MRRRSLAVVSLTALLGALMGCTGSPSVPVPTVTTTKSAVSVQSSATPSLSPPNVIGMAIDQASNRIHNAQCMVTAEHIVNHSGTRVGEVLAQQVVSAYCEVALTVSAGPPPTSVAACHSLAVHEGSTGVGLGHSGAALTFWNTGSAPCALRGYPDLTAREQHSNKTITARHTAQGYLGGSSEPLVTYVLLPGDSVSALYEETDNPPPGQDGCPAFSTYRVTAGGHTTALPGPGSDCSGIEIHPYVPGTSGSAR